MNLNVSVAAYMREIIAVVHVWGRLTQQDFRLKDHKKSATTVGRFLIFSGSTNIEISIISAAKNAVLLLR